LNIAHSLRSRGELSEHISFAVAANPQLDGDPSSLRMKLDAGAEVVFTQPSLLDGRMRRWFDACRYMLADTPLLVGLACLTCVEDVRLWLRLCSIRDADGAALLAAWQSATDEGPQAVDQLANKSLRQALEEAHTHGAAGVHVMPINTRGFKFAARVLPAELERLK
jgi:5,10-methylenetetrahydrofolate reductase